MRIFFIFQSFSFFSFQSSKVDIAASSVVQNRARNVGFFPEILRDLENSIFYRFCSTLLGLCMKTTTRAALRHRPIKAAIFKKLFNKKIANFKMLNLDLNPNFIPIKLLFVYCE